VDVVRIGVDQFAVDSLWDAEGHSPAFGARAVESIPVVIAVTREHDAVRNEGDVAHATVAVSPGIPGQRRPSARRVETDQPGLVVAGTPIVADGHAAVADVHADRGGVRSIAPRDRAVGLERVEHALEAAVPVSALVPTHGDVTGAFVGIDVDDERQEKAGVPLWRADL
jgi:hypothetical protein